MIYENKDIQQCPPPPPPPPQKKLRLLYFISHKNMTQYYAL